MSPGSALCLHKPCQRLTPERGMYPCCMTFPVGLDQERRVVPVPAHNQRNVADRPARPTEREARVPFLRFLRARRLVCRAGRLHAALRSCRRRLRKEPTPAATRRRGRGCGRGRRGRGWCRGRETGRGRSGRWLGGRCRMCSSEVSSRRGCVACGSRSDILRERVHCFNQLAHALHQRVAGSRGARGVPLQAHLRAPTLSAKHKARE